MSDVVLIVIIGMLGLIWFSSREIKTRKIDPCILHKWDYDTNNEMYCKACKRTPGEIGNET